VPSMCSAVGLVNTNVVSQVPRMGRCASAARTLAADGKTANFKFTPDEQEFKCMLAPEAFAPVPNAWGRQGWTTATLSKLKPAELKAALETAWQHAVPKQPKKRGKVRSIK